MNLDLDLVAIGATVALLILVAWSVDMYKKGRR